MSDLARIMIANTTTGSLGTINDDGTPFVSLVNVAATGPTTMVMLLSGLAVHTQNLNRRPNGSLLLVQADSASADPLAGARLTLGGVIDRLADDQGARAVFLSAHPAASTYIDFADFAVYQMNIATAYLVAGFGRIESIPIEALAAT